MSSPSPLKRVLEQEECKRVIVKRREEEEEISAGKKEPTQTHAHTTTRKKVQEATSKMYCIVFHIPVLRSAPARAKFKRKVPRGHPPSFSLSLSGPRPREAQGDLRVLRGQPLYDLEREGGECFSDCVNTTSGSLYARRYNFIIVHTQGSHPSSSLGNKSSCFNTPFLGNRNNKRGRKD